MRSGMVLKSRLVLELEESMVRGWSSHDEWMQWLTGGIERTRTGYRKCSRKDEGA
jgi:hypothetical protein